MAFLSFRLTRVQQQCSRSHSYKTTRKEVEKNKRKMSGRGSGGGDGGGDSWLGLAWFGSAFSDENNDENEMR